MYRVLFLLFILNLVFFSACKKDLLHWQHIQKLNSSTTNNLYNVKFINDSICIAAGGKIFEQSTVLRSTDGGYTWAFVPDPQIAAVGQAMFGMSVDPLGQIFLCGEYGDVLHSKDNGLTWQYRRISNYLQYRGGVFPTPDTGIFVSTELYQKCSITRVDSAFNIIDNQVFLFGLNNIYMTSPSVGYIIGYGTVMKTTDRGNVWNFQDVKGDNFMAMYIHGDEIWMCGFNGSVYHTINGGEHWDRLRNGNDITIPHYNMRSIIFRDSSNGWIVCDDGKVLHSDDGGRHWAEYDRFTTDALRSIALCPNGDLLVAGDNGSLYRIIPK